MSSLVNFVMSSLEWLFQLTVKFGFPSYTLAIILLTIIIKLILYPLTFKQMKSMRMMQELQPKIKELDKKYKDDPKKKQEAMMDIYKEHGANPMSGCLPLLIQFPILIALFRGLQQFQPSDKEFYTLLGLINLSKPDPTGLVLPVLVGLTTFLQQYITSPNATDSTQRMMLYAMPVLFGWMTRNFPSGLALYWIVFSVAGTVQQIYINKSIKSVNLKDGSKDGAKK